jgi:hypothetical protein
VFLARRIHAVGSVNRFEIPKMLTRMSRRTRVEDVLAYASERHWLIDNGPRISPRRNPPVRRVTCLFLSSVNDDQDSRPGPFSRPSSAALVQRWKWPAPGAVLVMLRSGG